MQIKSNLKKNNHQDLALESRTQRRGLGSHPIILFFILYSLFFIPFSVSAFQKPPNNLGLVGYWSLDDGTGTIATDMSGKGSNGTLTNGPTWANGKRGKATRFDGVNDFITMGDAPPLKIAGTAITISAWVRHDSDSFKNWEFIAGKGDSTYRLSLCGGPSLCEGGATLNGFVFAVNDGTNLSVGSNIVPVTGRWYHVAATYNGSIARLYIDGVESATDSYATSIANDTQPFYIGENSQSVGRQWSGLIDEVRVYTRVLTASEISALYGSGSAKFTTPSSTGLVGYWPMDDATSTVASDLSGIKNQGRLNSFANPSTVTSGWGIGKRGGSLVFDGSDDNVTMTAPSSITGLGSFTYSMWIKPNTYTNGLCSDGAGTYFLDRVEAGNPLVSLKAIGGKYALQFRETANAGVPSCVSTTQDIALRQWTHVAMVRDFQNDYFIYLNGVFSNSFSLGGGGFDPGGALNPGTPKLGGHQSGTGGGQFSGSMDEFRIYNRALSAAEIAGLYRSGQVFTNASQNTKLTNGLVGLWSFNGQDITWGSNFMRDGSGNGNNGTLGSFSRTSSIDFGVSGQALKFDGSANQVTSATQFANPQTFSISIWFKTTVASGRKLIGFETGQTGTASMSYDRHLNMGTDGKIYFGWYPGSITTVASISTLNDGQWHHAVGTHNGSNGILYIDGVYQGTNTGSPQSYSGYWRIGGYKLATWTNSSDGYFSGSLDEARVYNRTITPQEVKQLYNMGRSQ